MYLLLNIANLVKVSTGINCNVHLVTIFTVHMKSELIMENICVFDKLQVSPDSSLVLHDLKDEIVFAEFLTNSTDFDILNNVKLVMTFIDMDVVLLYTKVQY